VLSPKDLHFSLPIRRIMTRPYFFLGRNWAKKRKEFLISSRREGKVVYSIEYYIV